VYTINSQSYRCVNDHTDNLVDDTALKREISKLCRENIEIFLRLMPTETPQQKRTKSSIFNKVVGFIQKTLQTFCQSNMARDDFIATTYNATYYPAVLFHEGKDRYFPQLPQGVPRTGFKEFYVRQARRLFDLMTTSLPTVAPFRTHESIMKQAHLNQCRIPASAILVDESQDLDGAQIAWLTDQHRLYGTHIVLVGDPAQSIYSFRGSKSNLLVEVPNCCDMTLTNSYRFGQSIAGIANSVLHCKAISPQTIGQRKPTWIPYRLSGNGGEGRVTAHPLDNFPLCTCQPSPDLGKEKGCPQDEGKKISETSMSRTCQCDKRIVVLAFSNMDLFQYALTLMPLDAGEGEWEMESQDVKKIALNSSGEFSGGNLWGDVKKILGEFFSLYQGISSTLSFYPFDGEKGLSWLGVVQEVQTLDPPNQKLSSAVELVLKYEDATMRIYSKFEKYILNRRYSPLDPSVDVILSTIHAAKGMEWNHVQVLDTSLKALSVYKLTPPSSDVSGRLAINGALSSPLSTSQSEKTPRLQSATSALRQDKPLMNAQLDWLSYGDAYNLWYVALTRAKKTLSVPQKYVDLVLDMRRMEGSNGSCDHESPVLIKQENEEEDAVCPCTPTRLSGEPLSTDPHITPVKRKRTSVDIDSAEAVIIGGKPRTAHEVLSLYHHVGRPWIEERMEEGGLCIDNAVYFGQSEEVKDELEVEDC
jgi:hypothetical protein